MLATETMQALRRFSEGPLPRLLATDLDGTLAPIVERPQDARVPPATLAVLDRLAAAVTVAVITGRDLNTARRMVPCEGVVVVGSHGLEASFESPLLPEVDRLALAAALEEAEERVIEAAPTIYLNIERKAISTAFHFRTAPELEPIIRKALTPLPKGLRLREGRMVLEVLPDARGGKDVALLALQEHVKARSLLVMGDDLTDVAMFRAALTLRERGATVVIAGVSGGPETPPEIGQLADTMLHSPEEVLEALQFVARQLGV
ncbi:Trehalose-phosphate phosphatase [bacterium HR29]|jgi:trehalose-phosphatase|nr:Trehalose-phosphate phosphatase [bacterium HR29]